MTSNLQILCVTKNPRNDAHLRISSIGGRNADGTPWNLSTDVAIQLIEQGKYSFYVDRPFGDRVDVVVATYAYGHKYLKTVADGDQPNNLLSLDACPV